MYVSVISVVSLHIWTKRLIQVSKVTKLTAAGNKEKAGKQGKKQLNFAICTLYTFNIWTIYKDQLQQLKS